ncbi:RARA protein, partial [Polyodon spathula]|nr:RARA protein [Polyodon spathula]
MASNSSSCPNPQGGTHLNGYPVQHYPFFFPHVIGGLSPPGLAALQHQLPVSSYSTPSPASRYPTVR